MIPRLLFVIKLIIFFTSNLELEFSSKILMACKILCIGFVSSITEVSGFVRFPVNMRSTPDIHQSSGSNYWRIGAGALGGDKYICGSRGKSGQT